MVTIFDWLAVTLFAAIAVTFLQRSLTAPTWPDRIIHYVPPSIGCAAANWLGNEGHGFWATLVLAASAAYFVRVIRPLRA